MSISEGKGDRKRGTKEYIAWKESQTRLDQQVQTQLMSQESYILHLYVDEKPYFCVELNHPFFESAECDRGWNGDRIYPAFT